MNWKIGKLIKGMSLCCALGIGALMGADYSEDLGTRPVGPITHDFAPKAGQSGAEIVSGECIQNGDWGWNGGMANYAGNVVEGDASANAAGEHCGKFRGTLKYSGNGNGGGTVDNTWFAALTGKGEKEKIEFKMPICVCSFDPSIIVFTSIATSKPDATITLTISFRNNIRQTSTTELGSKCELIHRIESQSGNLLRPFLNDWLVVAKAKHSDGTLKTIEQIPSSK